MHPLCSCLMRQLVFVFLGGRKMAEYMLDVIHSGEIRYGEVGVPKVSAPSTSFIDGRER